MPSILEVCRPICWLHLIVLSCTLQLTMILIPYTTYSCQMRTHARVHVLRNETPWLCRHCRTAGKLQPTEYIARSKVSENLMSRMTPAVAIRGAESQRCGGCTMTEVHKGSTVRLLEGRHDADAVAFLMLSLGTCRVEVLKEACCRCRPGLGNLPTSASQQPAGQGRFAGNFGGQMPQVRIKSHPVPCNTALEKLCHEWLAGGLHST